MGRLGDAEGITRRSSPRPGCGVISAIPRERSSRCDDQSLHRAIRQAWTPRHGRPGALAPASRSVRMAWWQSALPLGLRLAQGERGLFSPLQGVPEAGLCCRVQQLPGSQAAGRRSGRRSSVVCAQLTKLINPTNIRLLIAPMAASSRTSGPRETTRLAIKKSLKAGLIPFYPRGRSARCCCLHAFTQ